MPNAHGRPSVLWQALVCTASRADAWATSELLFQATALCSLGQRSVMPPTFNKAARLGLPADNLTRPVLNKALRLGPAPGGASYYSFSPHPTYRFIVTDSYDVSVLGEQKHALASLQQPLVGMCCDKQLCCQPQSLSQDIGPGSMYVCASEEHFKRHACGCVPRICPLPPALWRVICTAREVHCQVVLLLCCRLA